MTQVVRLKIELEDVEPKVTRRIEVPLEFRLDRLHRVMQVVMPWEDYHLYEFRVSRSLAYGIADRDWSPETRSAARATLGDLLDNLSGKTFRYLYDFGDDWSHKIKVEAVTEADPEAGYPRLLAASGACPPEDSGGPWGYAYYLEAIADPEHEGHEEMIGWRGPGFDPNWVDEAEIRKGLARFARARRRGKAAKTER